jgi:hypothetical protein
VDILRKAIEIKDVTPQGIVVAAFSTLNVIDKDGDVTLPGFFGQQETAMVPAHDWRSVPLGKGTIKEIGDKAVAELKMNLDLQAAKDWHSALLFDLKNGRPLQEWSYGFTILPGGSSPGEFNGKQVRFLRPTPEGGPGARVHEVSPVLVGAGEMTGTLAAKSAKEAIAVHHTGTDKGAWDGGEQVRRAKEGQTAGYYGRIFAYREDNADPTLKGSYKLPHHEVSGSGDPGAANVKGCIAAIGALNGARGGADIPASERKAVYAHLAAHLKDAGVDVPPLKEHEPEEAGLTFSDEAKAALVAVEGLVARAKSLADLRAKDGRCLSAVSQEYLKSLGDRLQAALTAIGGLTLDDEARKAAHVELGRFLRAHP